MSLLRSAPLRSKSTKAIDRDKVLAATKRKVLARANGLCECGGEPTRAQARAKGIPVECCGRPYEATA